MHIKHTAIVMHIGAGKTYWAQRHPSIFVDVDDIVDEALEALGEGGVRRLREEATSTGLESITPFVVGAIRDYIPRMEERILLLHTAYEGLIERFRFLMHEPLGDEELERRLKGRRWHKSNSLRTELEMARINRDAHLAMICGDGLPTLRITEDELGRPYVTGVRR